MSLIFGPWQNDSKKLGGGKKNKPVDRKGGKKIFISHSTEGGNLSEKKDGYRDGLIRG
jgi:hypothetical protein